MAVFSISPVNSLSFVKIDSYLPNFTNTLMQDLSFIGVTKAPYCQNIQKTDVVNIQIRTDYTAVTAWMYNVATGAVTTLTPVVDTIYTDFSFWKIPITFSTNGYFKIFITATLTDATTLNYVSEMIEVRDSWDGVVVQCYNYGNTSEVDYSTGLVHTLRLFGIIRFSDIGGKDEFYNNFGAEERVYSESETIYELYIENIPYYLVRKILYCSKLDVFKVNDINFTVKEHSYNPHPGSTSGDLVLKLSQKEVEGISAFTEFGSGLITADNDIITTDNG